MGIIILNRMIRPYLFLFCSLTLIVFDVNGVALATSIASCNCFNPWAGKRYYKHIGDPKVTCSGPRYCFIHPNDPCPDKKKFEKFPDKYISKQACAGITGSGYEPNSWKPRPKPRPPPPCKPYQPCTPNWITTTTRRPTTTWTPRSTTTWTPRSTTTWTPRSTTTWKPNPPKGRCKCIDPSKGTDRKWGDPRQCCPKFCYVSCHSRCRDKKNAQGYGRCWSKLGCTDSNVVPYG